VSCHASNNTLAVFEVLQKGTAPNQSTCRGQLVNAHPKLFACCTMFAYICAGEALPGPYVYWLS
jgi:hypothetical protein